MLKDFSEEIEQRPVLTAINTALGDSKDLLRKSINSVVWIKDVDLDGNTLDPTRDFVRLCIDWVKEHDENLGVNAFYVVDRKLLDSLSAQVYGFSDMWRIEEVIREKAIDSGEKFLEEVKDMFSQEGIETTTKVKFGNPTREISKEAKAIHAHSILTGGNNLTKTIKPNPCPVVQLVPERKEKLLSKIKGHLSTRV